MLEAALEAFAERGFEGTSVREVARGLGREPQPHPAAHRFEGRALAGRRSTTGSPTSPLALAEEVNAVTPADDLVILRASW